MRNDHKANIVKISCLAALLSMAVLSGCGKKTDGGEESLVSEEAEGAAQTEAEGTAGTEAEEESLQASETQETYPGTISAEEGGEERSYGVMYASVIDVQTDEEGQQIYSLQDVNDPENAWTLSNRDIGDVAAELEKGGTAALLFAGDIVQDAENVSFIAAVPYSDYELGKATGVTENNVMSTFVLRLADGQTMTFLKDNCPMEEGALAQNEGDRIVVYYAYSKLEEIYYPLEIFSAE